MTPTAWLSLETNPNFRANACNTMRWLCTQALKQAGSLELMMWVRDMAWQELKEHLMVYFPGVGWECWAEPGETVFDRWHEDRLKRGHEKDIELMLGVEEYKAREVTGGGKNMRAIEKPSAMSRLHPQAATRVVEDAE